MKPRLLGFILFTYVTYAVARLTTDRNPPNSIDEAGIRKVASRLAIGMREEDVIQLFATNRLRMHARVQDTNYWLLYCCYHDGKTTSSQCFSMTFRQVPAPPKPVMRDARGLMV